MKLLLGLALVLAACGSKSNPPTQPPPPTCKATGCSGTLCASEDMASTCEWRAEYACYKTATCEWQASGQCGWRETPELTACIANPPPSPETDTPPGTPPPM